MSEPAGPPPHRTLRRKRTLSAVARAALATAFAFVAPHTAAQTTLGEVLDAGATRLNIEDFQQEVVQHLLVGKSPAGGDLEIVYGVNGTVDGTGSPPRVASVMIQRVVISGRWTTDKDGRICTTLRYGFVMGASSDSLPPRCQYWFKLGDAYFVSDYDSDRSAKVLRRTLKPPASAGVDASAPKTLGDLRDAGATKLSKQQVLDAFNGAAVSGPRFGGGAYQIVYKPGGTFAGTYQGAPERQGRGGNFVGKWTVDDNGKFCAEPGILLDPALRRSLAGSAGIGAPDTNCGFIFRLGDDYYGCASESDRSAPVFKRVVKR